MKKTIFLGLLSMSILVDVYATERKERNQTKSESLNVSHGVPSSSIIKEYYENGKVKSSIPYRGDTMNGIRKEFFETGKLLVRIPYKKGILHGLFQYYYSSGKLRLEIPFKNNTLDGMLKAYYPTGKLKYKTPFKKGKKSGIGTIYSQTGKEKSKLFYNDVYNDIIKIYSENDKLLIKITIENGKVTDTL